LVFLPSYEKKNSFFFNFDFIHGFSFKVHGYENQNQHFYTKTVVAYTKVEIMMKTLYQRPGNLKFHLITWFSFILYETIILGLFMGKFLYLGDYIIHYAHSIALFYFHTHVVLYVTLRKRLIPVWTIPFVVLLEIVLYLLVLFVLDSIAARFPSIFGMGEVVIDKSYLLKYIWRALYFIGFSTGYYFLITFLKERERATTLEKQQLNQIIEQQKMEKELAKAQNAYLRAQINPHFLFNTLNFIYNKTRKTAPVAADAILTLSAMMRYAVETNEEKGHILIEEEIEQVYNLIHLHKLRQNQQIYFEVLVQQGVQKLSIIPLILITLAENIFKHGNLSLKNHPAFIKVYIFENTLYIETDNLINSIHNTSGLSKGLENIEKRLHTTYSTAAQFFYTTAGHNHFKTQVIIKLEALSVFALPADISENIDK